MSQPKVSSSTQPSSYIEPEDSSASDSAVSDLDSLYSDADTASMTETLASKWTKYKYSHGRRYAAHDSEGQIVPNDEIQQDQLDIMHEVYLRAKGGDMFRAPIGEKPQRILDVGTGTGIWAMQVADMYPSAAVIGTDISPIQPEWVPTNCSFEVNDFNEASWSYKPNTFDLVHARALHSNVNNWQQFAKSAFHILKPGGYLEVCGEVAEMRCDDNTLPSDSPLHLWMKCAKEGTDKIGKPMWSHDKIEQACRDAGFDMTTFKQTFVKVPIGTWPKDKKLKELGGYALVGIIQGVEGYMIALYTGLLDWKEEDVRKHMGEVIRALKDRKSHVYLRYHTSYAMKPLDAGEAPGSKTSDTVGPSSP